MAESQIPPVIRQAFDEPAPPDPPEMDADDDGGDGHHLHIVVPMVSIYGDGAVMLNGWPAVALCAWFNVASFVAIVLATYGLCLWFSGLSMAWQWGLAAGAGFVTGCVIGYVTDRRRTVKR